MFVTKKFLKKLMNGLIKENKMNQPKVLEVLNKITLETFDSFISGKSNIKPVKFEDGKYFVIEKSVDEETFKMSLNFLVMDKDPYVKFSTMKWSKEYDKETIKTQLRLYGTLWVDYATPEELEDEAKKLIVQDNIIEVIIQKVVKETDNVLDVLYTYSLSVREKIASTWIPGNPLY